MWGWESLLNTTEVPECPQNQGQGAGETPDPTPWAGPAIHSSKGSCWPRTEPGEGVTWKLTRSSLGSLWKRLCLPARGSRGFSMHWDRKVQAAPKGTWGGTVPPVWPCCSCPTRNPGIPPSLKIQEAPPQLPLPQQWGTGFTGFNVLQLLN